MPKALGLVETRGLVAAIEAADAMVKTSNVTLIGKEVTNPALITIKIVGDVAAVKASVDAGAAAAARVGELVSIHVIPQPDSQMTALFPEIADDDPGEGRKTKPDRKRKTETDGSSFENKPTGAGKDSVVDISAKKAEQETDKTVPEKKSGGAVHTTKPSAAGKPEAAEQAAMKPVREPGGDISSSEKEKPKVPVSKPVKAHAPKPQKESEGANLFSVNTDHLERLRREALGIKEPKEEQQSIKPAEKPTAEKQAKRGGSQEIPSMEELEKLNVHNLRKAARAMEGFPIQGRDISRANRRELLDLFKKII